MKQERKIKCPFVCVCVCKDIGYHTALGYIWSRFTLLETTQIVVARFETSRHVFSRLAARMRMSPHRKHQDIWNNYSENYQI